MKSEKGLLIFTISIIIFFFSSCSLKTECDKVEFDIDKVIGVIKTNSSSADKLLLLEAYMLVNNIYAEEINALKSEGYIETDCVELNSKIVESISVDKINTKMYDENYIIELAKPLYQKSSNSIAILGTFHCGSDCGGVNLYFFKKEEKKWQLKEPKSLGQF